MLTMESTIPVNLIQLETQSFLGGFVFPLMLSEKTDIDMEVILSM